MPVDRIHAEAFSLMRYQDMTTGERELIWNSRDGVTPFYITSKAGNEARHVDFHRDHFAPGYTPANGDRVFVDLTLERAREHRRRYVDKYWDVPIHGSKMRDHGAWATKDEAVEQLAQGDVGHGGAPETIVVDDVFLLELRRRRRSLR